MDGIHWNSTTGNMLIRNWMYFFVDGRKVLDREAEWKTDPPDLLHLMCLMDVDTETRKTTTTTKKKSGWKKLQECLESNELSWLWRWVIKRQPFVDWNKRTTSGCYLLWSSANYGPAVAQTTNQKMFPTPKNIQLNFFLFFFFFSTDELI